MDARPSEKDHVTVIERRSGRVLTGLSAPTEVKLELWLQTHPSYEVVLPGTTGATPPSSSSKCLGHTTHLGHTLFCACSVSTPSAWQCAAWLVFKPDVFHLLACL